MPNILSPIKNSFYNLETIDPVNITVELPENRNSFFGPEVIISV